VVGVWLYLAQVVVNLYQNLLSLKSFERPYMVGKPVNIVVAE
jgi:hypothetical protein